MSPRPDPAAVVQGADTVSGKIRALDRAGYSRSEIAALLGKRYQHVRNVLVDDARRAGSSPIPPISDRLGLEETDAGFEHAADVGFTQRLEVGRDGQVHLPESFLESLGVVGGGGIVACLEADGSVRLLGARQSLERIRKLLGPILSSGVSLVDELIADRRAEAERENSDG